MKRISKVAGAIDTGGGGRIGLAAGGRAAGPPVALLVTEALMKRPNSSDGHVVNRPARRETAASRAGQRRRGRNRVLTIGARCSVISTDCIQNVDDSQPLTAGIVPPNTFGGARRTASGVRAVSQAVGDADRLQGPPPLIRIGVGAWRVGPRPQPAASRRTIAATSPSGTPTGQAAAAASKSGESPSTSEAASPNRA